MPDVVFDPVKVTFSALFIDPNGDRLNGGRVIGRRGQSHGYLFALAVNGKDGVAVAWGGFLDGRDVIGGPMNFNLNRVHPKNLQFIGWLDGRSLNLFGVWLRIGSRGISSK